MTGLMALAGFTAVTLLLPLIYAGYRVPLVLSRAKAADHWTRGRPEDDPGLIIRLKHAHLNCLENLAPFAAVVLLAVALDQHAVIDALAPFVLYARLVQIGVHSLGTSFPLVLVRATMFIAQVILMLYMLYCLV
ncbi:MAG: MAPEG family protein [Abyssibacter sp.]|uniref:MAPEG family protein n=1 Tax=Abyssibacter sp. TaxID=2320200 RepID=UPI002E9ED2DD|nr:MAPEG family protein [Pseudomonadota bacterium]